MSQTDKHDPQLTMADSRASRRTFLVGAARTTSLLSLGSLLPSALESSTLLAGDTAQAAPPAASSAAVGAPVAAPAASAAKGPFSLPALPYADNALDPVISSKTIGFHYGKHHQGYVTKLNELVAGTPLASLSLEEVIKKTAGDSAQAAIFNAAAQTWNHTFYWNSLKPKGGGAPTGKLLEAINGAFGDFDKFKEAFIKANVGLFGSGWTWLVVEGGKLKIQQTFNADLPLVHGQTALLTVDDWEHAYYLDYQNKRKDYVEAVVNGLLNWDFAAQNLARLG